MREGLLWLGVIVCMSICVHCCMLMCVCVCVLGFYQVSVPVLPQASRGDRWSWDLDEERKRQERWQQEQERMLQVHSNTSKGKAWHAGLRG